jgi:DnaK suppressor protein
MNGRLSEAQLDELKGRLRERQSALQSELEEEVGGTYEAADLERLLGPVRDEGDESVDRLIADMNMRRVQQLSDALDAVDRALTAVQEGRYGICARCGLDIGYERLSADPTVALCIHCQQRYEQEYGSGRLPSL